MTNLSPFKTLKNYFRFQSSIGKVEKIPLKGSVDYRLRQLASKPRPQLDGGMMGALQVFQSFIAPTRSECIRQAASNLISHRQCVIANAKQGRNYKGDYWLNRAAFWRREAMRAE